MIHSWIWRWTVITVAVLLTAVALALLLHNTLVLLRGGAMSEASESAIYKELVLAFFILIFVGAWWGLWSL